MILWIKGNKIWLLQDTESEGAYLLSNLLFACIASVSVQFPSKERGRRVKNRAKNWARSRSIFLAVKTKNPVPRSFFAPKPNRNACYADQVINSRQNYSLFISMICIVNRHQRREEEELEGGGGFWSCSNFKSCWKFAEHNIYTCVPQYGSHLCHSLLLPKILGLIKMLF